MTNRHYLSQPLIHWTGRAKSDAEAFASLQSICEEQILRLAYCPSYVQPSFRPRSAVACFTDIPLPYSKEHCARFGRFGIAFARPAMIHYGANPVFYTTAPHLERIRQISSLLDRMKGMEKDREWLNEAEPYSFTEDQTLSLLEVLEFTQEYSYKNQDDSDYVTYFQREWRLAFNALPFAGGSTSHSPGMSSFYARSGITYKIFRFAPTDVAFLVVPLRFWWSARKLAKLFECRVLAYEIAVGT